MMIKRVCAEWFRQRTAAHVGMLVRRCSWSLWHVAVQESNRGRQVSVLCYVRVWHLQLLLPLEFVGGLLPIESLTSILNFLQAINIV